MRGFCFCYCGCRKPTTEERHGKMCEDCDRGFHIPEVITRQRQSEDAAKEKAKKYFGTTEDPEKAGIAEVKAGRSPHVQWNQFLEMIEDDVPIYFATSDRAIHFDDFVKLTNPAAARSPLILESEKKQILELIEKTKPIKKAWEIFWQGECRLMFRAGRFAK